MLIALTLIFAAFAVVLEIAYCRSRQPMNERASGCGLDRIGVVPDFSLVDRTGARVTLADLKGKVWLAAFIYTTCPDSCPMLSNRLAAWQHDALACGDLRIVTFSVDPARDTPEVLQRYAERFHATDRWLFLTGDKKQIARIAREGFLAAYASATAPGIGGITHSTHIALVDRTGVVRRVYDGLGADQRAEMLRDAKLFLKERAAP